MEGTFRIGENVYKEGHHAIFPLVTINNGNFTFVATAFFIAKNGTFCTAKHVLYNKLNNIDNHLFGVFFYNNNKYSFRKVVAVINTSKSDIAIGMLEEIYDGLNNVIKNKVMNLSRKKIKIGDFVATYAYPKSTIKKENILTILSFDPSWHFGKVTDAHPNGRDSVLLPGACYQTSIEILGGASGGPVGNADGQICGVNSTGYDFSDEQENVSFITPISEIFEMKINVGGEQLTVLQLAQRNFISIK